MLQKMGEQKWSIREIEQHLECNLDISHAPLPSFFVGEIC